MQLQLRMHENSVIMYTYVWSCIYVMYNVWNNVWYSHATAVILYECHLEEDLKCVQLWPTRGC